MNLHDMLLFTTLRGNAGGGSGGGDGYSYRVRFYVDGVLHDEQWVRHGESATAPAEPTKESMEFVGWDDDYRNVTVPKDINAAFRFVAVVQSRNLVERNLSGDYANDRVTSTRRGSIQGCNELVSINLPLVTNLAEHSLSASAQLTKVDVSSVTNINYMALVSCSQLSTFIIRNKSQVVTLGNISAFNGTKIASGAGHIYVPSALLDSYRSATNWSNFANQFRAIEDHPDVCGGE